MKNEVLALRKISQAQFDAKLKKHSLRKRHWELLFVNYNLSEIIFDQLESNVRFQDCDMSSRSFTYKELKYITFENCNLNQSCFYNSRLKRVVFNNCNLINVSFTNAILIYSTFFKSNLKSSDLKTVSIKDATFNCCNLTDVLFPSPFELFNIYWGNLSDELTQKAMGLDAGYYYGNVEKFNEWAKEFNCPYSSNTFSRIINFQEKADLWKPELINMKINLYQFLRDLFKEKECIVNF